MLTEHQPAYVCSICQMRYATAEAALSCEQQGLQENLFRVGDTLTLPWCGGVTLQVIELVAACHIDHEPGVYCAAVAGNVEGYLSYLQDPYNRQFFDQETARKYKD